MPKSPIAAIWPFFHVNSSGRITAFNTDTCEQCGKPTVKEQVGMHETPRRLRSLGLQELATIPPEQYWVDELGGCACENCLALMPAVQVAC